MGLTILTGCGVGVSDSALIDGIEPAIKAHATALAGDDVDLMRRTGRVLIAQIDAAGNN